MNQLQPQVYANVVAPLNSNPFGVAFRRLEDRIEGQNVPYELPVLSYQQNIASLARAYKNQAQGQAQQLVQQTGQMLVPQQGYLLGVPQ